MSGFSSEWLALREPLDLAARNQEVEAAFFEQLPGQRLRLLDLASGAGSTVAALGKTRSHSVDWLLTDYDQTLLDIAAKRWGSPTGSDVSLQRIDLASDLEQLPFDQVDAVTTSAFLDLTSEDFLSRLVDRVTKAQKPFLASLSYDGRAEFSPELDVDRELRDALNAHQKTDKGFGRSLGPDAVHRAIELFQAQGYRVIQGTSDWQIGPDAAEFLAEFLSGWVRVGQEVELDPDMLDAWWQDRLVHIRSGQLSMVVGHVDFAAFPQ